MESLVLDSVELGIGNVSNVEIRDNSTRARTAIIFLWVMVGLDVVFTLSNLRQFMLLYAAANGDYATYEEARANDLRQLAIGGVYLIGNILCIVFFIMWFRRAYFNLHKLDGSYLSYREGWAAGAWFIPLFNLFGPYRIMKEITADTAYHAQKSSGNPVVIDAGLGLVGWWWAAWISDRILSRICSLMNKGQQLDTLLMASGLSMFTLVIDVVAAILLIKIIKKVSEAEKIMFEHRSKLIPAGRL